MKNNTMFKSIISFRVIVLFTFLQVLFQSINAQEYAIGADLSFLKDAEDKGFVLKENGIAKEGLQIFKDHGYGWIRLRLFHTPTTLPNSLEYTIALTKKAKSMGFKFLLCLHYSDSWADPGKQTPPKAWDGMTHGQLVKAVFGYTRETIKSLRLAGVMPEMVAVGNEIQNGMLWPDGKLPGNWDNFADLIQAGINGVNAGCDSANRPDIMIHIGPGANKKDTKAFFDKYFSYGLDLDYIGQSYYPWWQGSLLELRDNFIFMAGAYKKPIILVEVAYCASPTEYKSRPGPFPETPEGQKEFLEEVNKIVLSTPDNLGAGIFWWEPATRSGGRSAARDFFDENGNVLPVITVFDKYTRH